MTPRDILERRFRRLLRFYPPQYRAERGDEIVSTYMDSAPADRTGPSLADMGDIATAGLRQRLRHVEGLPGGLRLAAVAAMCVAVVTGASMGPGVVLGIAARPDQTAVLVSPAPFSPFLDPNVILWTLWVLVGIGATFLPGKLTRVAVGVALLASLATLPLEFASEYAYLSPDPVVLSAQIVCGVMALAWPDNPSRFARAAPLIAIPLGIAATVTSAFLPSSARVYWGTEAIPAGFLLVTVAVIAARAIVIRRGRSRGWWAIAISMIPVSVVVLRPTLNLNLVGNVPGSGLPPYAMDIAAVAWLTLGLAVPIGSYIVATRHDRLPRR